MGSVSSERAERSQHAGEAQALGGYGEEAVYEGVVSGDREPQNSGEERTRVCRKRSLIWASPGEGAGESQPAGHTEHGHEG